MTVPRTTSRKLLLGALLLLAFAGALALGAQAFAATGPDAEATRMAIDPSLSPAEARRLRFLFWAYAAIWTLLAAYLVSLGIRLRAVRAEIGRVRARLDAPRAGGGAA